MSAIQRKDAARLPSLPRLSQSLSATSETEANQPSLAPETTSQVFYERSCQEMITKLDLQEG